MGRAVRGGIFTSEPERLRVFCYSVYQTLCTSKTCQENYTPIMDNTITFTELLCDIIHGDADVLL